MSGVWAGERRALTIGLVLTVTAFAFEALAVATILPAVSEDLGGLRLYGWVFSAFMLANIVGIVIAGEASDRVGPAGPFAAGLSVFSIGLLVAGTAPTMVVLVTARILQGLGAGTLTSTVYVAAGRGYSSEHRTRLLAVLSSAWVLPGLLGPVVAAAIAHAFSWRWVFLGLLPAMPLTAVLTLPSLRGLGPPGGSEAVDGRAASRLPAALRLAAGTGLFLAGTTAANAVAVVGGMAVGAAIGLPALARLLPTGTLRAAPGMPAAVASVGLLSAAFFTGESFLPLLLTTVRRQPEAVAGLCLTAAALTWTAAAWSLDRLRKRGPRPIVGAGFALVLVGVALAASVLWTEVPVAVAALAWALGGAGMGLGYNTSMVAVLDGADEGQEGTASSSASLANFIGIAVGAGVGGAFVAQADSAGLTTRAALVGPFALAVALGAVGLAASRRLGAPTPAVVRSGPPDP